MLHKIIAFVANIATKRLKNCNIGAYQGAESLQSILELREAFPKIILKGILGFLGEKGEKKETSK